MADASLKEWALRQVRKSGGVYGALQVVGRWTANTSVEILRRLSSHALRFGPPKGTFFAVELMKRREVQGELLLERQELAPVPPDAMRIRSGLNQHRHQPWPIFWNCHTVARLAGPTLVLMDGNGR